RDAAGNEVLREIRNYLVVATTRPETMLGDTAVMVHPDDPRYAALHGAFVELPLSGRRIPLITDDYVDRDFATGVVKVTPAHDFNDAPAGRPAGRPMPTICPGPAPANDEGPVKGRALAGYQARKARRAGLGALGLPGETKSHGLQVPRAARGGQGIE